MAVDVKFVTAVGVNNSRLLIRDLSDYDDDDSTKNRSVMVWVTDREENTLETYDFGTTAPMIDHPFWELFVTEKNLYKVTLAFARTWVDGVWDAGSIVQYDGNFYVADTSISLGDPAPDVNNDWSVITGTLTDYAKLENAATRVSTYPIYKASVFFYAYDFSSAQSDTFNLDRLECYKYRCTMEGSTFGYDAMTINLYTYDSYFNGGSASNTYVNTGSDISVDFEVDDDGLYIVEVYPMVWDGSEYVQATTATYFILYEFCTLHSCMMTIIKDVLCNEEDTCCDSCDQDIVKQNSRKRAELNKAVSLYGLMLMYINLETVTYMGVFTIDDTREGYVTQVKNIYDKLVEIAQRCGDCDTETETTGCNNC